MPPYFADTFPVFLGGLATLREIDTATNHPQITPL